MIREGLDRHLPDEQWVGLQTHLEGCHACRKYRYTLLGLEKGLRRELLTRWEGMAWSGEVHAASFAEGHRQRITMRRRLGQAVLIGLGLLFFWVMGGFELIVPLLQGQGMARVARQELEEASYPFLAVDELSPGSFTSPDEFQSQIVFESSRDGDSDLYLLNPGGRLTNLTGADKAVDSNETFPAWSPDGNWIAFLSDQKDRNEVYISGVEGGEPVQLTREPGIAWVGPLSWSPDGRWIALTGIRQDQGKQSWIYIVSLAGEGGPRALAGTRGGWAPEFSPAGDRVAFVINNGLRASAAVFYFSELFHNPNTQNSLRWTTSNGLGTTIGPGVFQMNPDWQNGASGLLVTGQVMPVLQAGAGLDWTPDGTGLAFLASSLKEEGGAQVSAERELDYRASLDKYTLVRRIAESADPRLFQGVTWTANEAVVYGVQTSTGENGQLCLELKSRWFSGQTRIPPPQIPAGLCVESALDRSAWTSDGRWLVITGHQTGEPLTALYALSFPQGGEETSQAERLVRLADMKGEVVNPAVRPISNQAALEINLLGVDLSKKVQPLSDLSGIKGRIAFSLRNNEMTVIVSSSPAGNGGQVLSVSDGINRCPRFSPDGSLIAFVSDSVAHIAGKADERLGRGGGDELAALKGQGIYVMPAGGGPARQISSAEAVLDLFPEAARVKALRFDCPTWSPDSSTLAAALDTGAGSFLAILPVTDIGNDEREATFLEVGRLTSIAWEAGGRSVVASYRSLEDQKTHFLVASLPESSGDPVKWQAYEPPFDLGEMKGLAFGDKNRDLFLLASHLVAGHPELAVIEIRHMSLGSWVEHANLWVGPWKVVRSASPAAFAWLGSDGLGMVLQSGPDQRIKSLVQRYDIKLGQIDTLAYFEDTINSAAWSDDGKWVVFSAESGLWILDVEEARKGRAAPTWISPEPVYDLDWQ